MEGIRRKFPLTRKDGVFLLAALAIASLCCHLLLLLLPASARDRSDYKAAFVIILTFGILWIALLKTWKAKNINLRQRLLITGEATMLIVLGQIVGFFTGLLYFYVIDNLAMDVPLRLVPIIILGFDLGWIVLMFLWHRVDPHIRVVLTYAVLVVSGWLILFSIAMDSLSGPWF